MSTRRYDLHLRPSSGPTSLFSRIHFLRLVIEGDSLDAPRLARDGGCIGRAINEHRARALVEVYAALGETIELIETEPLHYVFDLHDPARAGQTMQRWQVRDATLAIERGRLASWTPTSTQTFSSSTEAHEALAARLSDARTRGLAVESDPLAVVRRLSARNPTLEAALQALDDLDHPAAHTQLQVYADFMQSEGDPRGTLAALQLRDSADASEWLDQHLTHIFGPLAPAVGRRREVDLTWTGGWITSLFVNRLPLSPSEPFDGHALEAFLQLPVCACLRTLEARGLELRSLGKAELELGPCRASLRSLRIDLDNYPRLDLGIVPALERLELCGDLRAQIDAPKLRELSISRAALEPVFDFLRTSKLGPIQSLALGFSPDHADSRECTGFQRILHHRALESLRELTLFGTGLGHLDHIGFFDDRWVDALLAAPLLARLERRDFTRLLMNPETRQRLREACAALPGETRV
ncbi:MAG TPA: hypothetical protein VM869_32100 [Enhygromyxa sp.]|nr:hypothetical protein [Enhygromyxa sp.]